MYDVTIKLDEVISTFSIEELKELREILEQFKKVDEFHLEYKESDLKADTSPKNKKIV